MPFAVTHILVPLLMTAIIRDFFLKKQKSKFSLHYVFIAGIAGILPDIDVAAFLFLRFFGFSFEQVHKTFLHSIFIPLIFFSLFLALSFRNKTNSNKIKPNIIFLMLALGTLSHLILDLFFEPFAPFNPFSDKIIGMNLINYLPPDLQSLFFPILDGALLIIWLSYLQFKHKISDFI